MNHKASFSTFMRCVVIHMGKTMKSKIASTIAKRVDKKSATLLCSFSSGRAISAEYCRVVIPIFIASKRDAIPRKIGLFHNLDRSVID